MNLRIQQKMGWAFILLISCWGCQSKTNQDKAEKSPIEENQAVSETSYCYAYQNGGDTIEVHMTQQANGAVKGYMLFQLKEKDKNEGTFTGEIKKNLVLAEYTFQSEGKTSIRQIAFQQSDSTLKEGYGEVFQQDGQQKFKNPEQLEFQHSMVLKKVDCGSLEL